MTKQKKRKKRGTILKENRGTEKVQKKIQTLNKSHSFQAAGY